MKLMTKVINSFKNGYKEQFKPMKSPSAPSNCHLKHILTNNQLFKQSPLDSSIFNTDLVIQMQVPNQQYTSRSNRMALGSMLRKYPKKLFKAYESAYQELFADMEAVGDQAQKQDGNDKELRIREFASFVGVGGRQDVRRDEREGGGGEPYVEKEKRIDNHYDQESILNLQCRDEYTGILDAFIISFNTLVYTLQALCEFKVRTFLVAYSGQQEAEIENVGSIDFLPGENHNNIFANLFTNIVEKTIDSRKKKYLQEIQKKNKDVKRKLYILLHLPEQNLMKAASKYHIKKQIDYHQIDPYINDPTDSCYRPLKYNQTINMFLASEQKQRKQEQQKQRTQQQLISHRNTQKKMKNPKKYSQNQQTNPKINSQEEENRNYEQLQFYRIRKTIDRKIGLKLPGRKDQRAILQQIQPKAQQIDKFVRFLQQFNKKIVQLVGGHYGGENGKNCFNDPSDADHVTEQEQNYLRRLCKGKYHLGIEKAYVKVKKQKKYYQILYETSQKYGYRHYEQPLIYTQFKLARQSQRSFFGRLQRLLLYKQIVCGPNGELSLFHKMQRIKLAYSILRQHLRVENLHMLKARIFALNDDYEKFGKVGKPGSKNFHYHFVEDEEDRSSQLGIYGGLDGRNLEKDWCQLFIWKTNFNTMRNYLGQSKTFQVLIKTSLIYLFVFLTPLGIAMEIIKRLFVEPEATVTAFMPQFWFYIAYMLMITFVYGVFTERYRRSEQNYMKNFVEESSYTEFLNQYKGPYLRDTNNDSANTYDQKFIKWFDQLKTYFIFFLFFLIFGFEVGFYYGMRELIVAVSYEIPQWDTTRFYLLRPIQLIGYGIFFICNSIAQRYIVTPMAQYLTKYQNRPTKQAFLISLNAKLFMFAIGVEMIGPIDLVFIQYAAKTSCSSAWCLNQFQAYVYCRYFLILFFLIISASNMLRRFFMNTEITLPRQKNQSITYQHKLKLFLQFVHKQSRKSPSADIRLVDETVALIHFATFVTVFPLAPAISFLSMLIDYNIQRMQILRNEQRPIPRSQKFQQYRRIIVAIGHWMLFFNFSYLFITLQWLQYLFPSIVLSILPNPSPYMLMTVKYLTIILFTLAYELLLAIVISLTRKVHSVMDTRKWNMLQKYQLKRLSEGGNVVLKDPKPLHSVSRTCNGTRGEGQMGDAREQETGDGMKVGKGVMRGK